MNPEIKTTVENMKRGKKESLASSDILVYQLSQMANLLSLLAEESEKQTDKMLSLTKGLMTLTKILFGVGIVQILIMVFQLIKQ